MAKFPDVQRTAQEELDRVIGLERLPQFSDRSSLPYVEAIVKECLRWNPILPLALPRTTFSDDEYKGYFIPKGSVVMANSWYDQQLLKLQSQLISDSIIQGVIKRPASLPRPRALST